MIIATWNVNSINARLDLFKSWAKEHDPDFILLQEIKCQDENFPYNDCSELGYKSQISGQKSYHGVALLSKIDPITCTKTFPDNPSEEARYLEATYQTHIGLIRIISVYVPNGSSINSDKYHIKLKFLANLKKHLDNLMLLDDKLIIGGDFNVAPFDIDVHDPIQLEGHLSFSSQEKILLRSILNAGYKDCYRIFNPTQQNFSWWDYRGGGLEKNQGWRIDFLLANPLLCDFVQDCYMDASLRSKEKPSDHIPVIVKIL